MKKIISFSLWGNNPKYTQGALENIKLATILYKRWICRFYIHKDVSSEIKQSIKNTGAEIIIINDPITTGMLWRFRVIMNKDIERFIIRDTDGRLTIREKNCVIDWIHSRKEFHIIRDNKMHRTKIMGGVWGATKEFMDRIDYNFILKSHDFKNTPNIFGYDQDFLAAKIYPLIKDTACIHDDFNFYKDENSRKIPHIREKNHYIGEPWNI